MGRRKTLFSKSDAYQWKTPKGFPFIKFTPFEDYTARLKDVFIFKRENGILEARFHTNGDSLLWDYYVHKCMHQFFTWAGQDHDNEVLILGGSGKNFVERLADPPAETEDPSENNNWKLYEATYYDGANNVEGAIYDLEIPTIAVWNGAAFHTEAFLFSDLCIATEDAWTSEMHFRVNMAPGDGTQIAWRELLGRRRFAYAELTGEIITARKALQYGMINEIQPDLEAAYARAWEIAELIMHSGSRVTRRITTQILRQPWREDIAKELRPTFGTEMFSDLAEEAPRDNTLWQGACEEAAAVMDAERRGKIIRPRLGDFIEEDEIK